MAKIVLVVIPTMENAYHNLIDFVAVMPPIGIASIAAAAEVAKHDVTIIDGDALKLSVDETIERVVTLNPAVVGSTLMTATMDLTSIFYRKLKEVLPNVLVVVGGPHVSALPEQTLSETHEIDICVIGEGDDTIIEIMEALSGAKFFADVAGIAYRDGHNIVVTEKRVPISNLSRLSMPAYHLFNPNLYRAYGWNKWVSGFRQPLGVIFTGRGCIGKCNFCAAHTVFGRGTRYFSIEQVKMQIDYLMEVWKIRILYFQDDTFTANRKMVNEICDYLIAKGYSNKLEIMVSSRVDTIHLPTLIKMRQASVRWICFGVESGNQEILNRISKRITVQQIRNAFKMSRQAGLFIAGNFMIGHVGETRESALDTINLATELDQEYASFAIAIPLPGTELYQHCIDEAIPLPSWNDFGSVNSPPISLNSLLDPEELMALRDLAVNRFFKRPIYLFRMLIRVRPINLIVDFVKMYLAIRVEKSAKRL